MKLITFMLLLSINANAFTYDVDWPSSTSKYHVLAITINGCETKVIVENKDLESVKQDSKELQKMIKYALKRSNNGCK